MKNIYTIGFTKKSLEEFITLLKNNKIQKIVDVRLNVSSQLAGFAKGRDLRFILELINIDYERVQKLAPDKSILKSYRQNKNWEEYEMDFEELMDKRGGKEILKKLLNGGKTICLLCSEDKADKCHRRLVAELLKGEDIEIIHL